ncbi:MAG: PD-(D/E)XK nuclease family protein [Caldisericia bacterium]
MGMSQSKLNTYVRCPHLYKLLYIDGIKFVKTVPLLIGIVAHKVMENCGNLLPQKMNVRQIYSDAAKSIINELGLGLSKQQYAEIYYPVISMLDVFYSNYPSNKPLAVERKFSLPYKNLTMTGVFDVIDQEANKLFILDYKSGKFMASDWLSLLSSFQTVIYQWAAEQIYGKPFTVKYWWLRWDETRTLNITSEIRAKTFRKISNIAVKINRCEFEHNPSSACQSCPAMATCIPGQKFIVDNTRICRKLPEPLLI